MFKATIAHTNTLIACALLAAIQMMALVLLLWPFADGPHIVAVLAAVGSQELVVAALFSPTAGIVWVAKHFAQRPAEVYRNGIEVGDG